MLDRLRCLVMAADFKSVGGQPARCAVQFDSEAGLYFLSIYILTVKTNMSIYMLSGGNYENKKSFNQGTA